MTEQPYSNREIRDKWDDIANALSRIEIQTTTTNGKVRRIILVLVGLGFFCIGLGLKEFLPLIMLLFAA